ncbi:MAG TPA: hypothetical protein PKD72_02200 [Gemmatales bacterium]|nr:hypothetical protein [Gemmatales bacterium]
MLRIASAMLLVLAVTQASFGHFLWLIPGDKPNTVKLVFSDKLGADLDNPELIDKVKQTGLYIHDPGSKHIDLSMEKETAAFVASFPEKAHVIRGKCDYGVFQRGNNPATFLKYYCIYKKGDLKDSACFHCQPLQAREEDPASEPGKFLIEYDGDPVADSEVTLVGPEGFKSLTGKTDKDGYVTFDMKNAPKGLYGLRAKHVAQEKGEHQGKPYETITSYVTLVFTR